MGINIVLKYLLKGKSDIFFIGYMCCFEIVDDLLWIWHIKDSYETHQSDSMKEKKKVGSTKNYIYFLAIVNTTKTRPFYIFLKYWKI